MIIKIPLTIVALISFYSLQLTDLFYSLKLLSAGFTHRRQLYSILTLELYEAEKSSKSSH